MDAKPIVTHERAIHVFGFLADFAEQYPQLCEQEQEMYRDLARAATIVMRNQDDLEPFTSAIDAVMAFGAKLRVKYDVGRFMLQAIRDKGVKLRLDGVTLRASPSDKVVTDVATLISRYKEELAAALEEESFAKVTV